MIVKFKKSPGHFIVVDRGMIDDNRSISYKAKGILTYLMGRPADWRPHMAEIALHAADKIGSIKSGIRELQRAGYVTISRIKHPDTKQWIGWEWYVTDVPTQHRPASDSPKVKNELTEANPKVKNELTAKQEKTPDSRGRAESRFSDLRKIDFVKEREIKRKGEEQKEREENARTQTPQDDIYGQVFGVDALAKLTDFQRELLHVMTDVQLMQTTCRWWAGNGHKPSSISRMVDRYHEQQGQRQSTPGQAPQRQDVFSRNLQILGVDPATYTQ